MPVGYVDTSESQSVTHEPQEADVFPVIWVVLPNTSYGLRGNRTAHSMGTLSMRPNPFRACFAVVAEVAIFARG